MEIARPAEKATQPAKKPAVDNGGTKARTGNEARRAAATAAAAPLVSQPAAPAVPTAPPVASVAKTPPTTNPPSAANPAAPPVQASITTPPPDAAAATDLAVAASDTPDGMPNCTGPSELLWRKWLVLIGSPFAGLVLMIGLMTIFFSSDASTVGPVAESPQTLDAAGSPGESSEAGENVLPDAKDVSNSLDARWLPNETRIVLSLTPADLAGQSGVERLLAAFGPCSTAAIIPAIEGLGLELNQISRITLAATDTEAATNRVAAAACSLIAIRLEADVDPGLFAEKGRPGKFTLHGIGCRHLKSPAWPHPFVVLPEARTIVTGPSRLLQELAGRSSPQFASRPIARLLETMNPASNLIAMLDVAAASHDRIAGKIKRLFAVWPAGRQAWQKICETPTGVGLNMQWPPGVQADITLVCSTRTAAEQLDATLAAFLPTAKTAVADRIRNLQEQLKSGAINRQWSDRYEVFLQHMLAVIRPIRRDVVDDVAWLRTSWDDDPVSIALAALDAVEPAKTDWLSAGLSRDREKQQSVLTGLNAYGRAKGSYPAGTVGGALLPPETRLSWLATLLPYQEHGDWHRRLQFGYPWNSEQNTPVTTRPLASVINPAMGPSKTDDGFPVTHYVGAAGIGRDAGHLSPGDPKAGVFGFSRTTRPRNIPDGAANTIAILGVSGRLGPWSAGGQPTVRGLTQRPYVNGPDGFGSGQANGMLAGMADGSTRFLSKDIDPGVLEQMATTHGGNSAGPIGVAAAKPPTPPAAVSAATVPRAVKARLAERLVRVDFHDIPLADVIEFIEQMTAIEIEFDNSPMSRLGVSRQVPVTLDLSGASVAEILDAALSPHGLSYVFRDGRLLVTGRP